MQTPAVPPNESERLADLRALRVLGTPPERRFDRVVELSSRVFEVPISYIALVDSDRQWLKAKCGLSMDSSGRDVSFCGHTILRQEPLIVEDARADDRFHDNPLVIGDPHVRFYAGHPLVGPNGYNVGTLCLADHRPRSLSGGELEVFRRLAELAQHELHMVDVIESQRQLIETRDALDHARRRLEGELAEAARYLRSLLPAPLAEGPVLVDWRYIGSSQVGGDLFGYARLDDGRFAVYLLDVCGHGVGPSLLAVSIRDAIARGSLLEARPDDPAAVLAALNQTFAMQGDEDKFFSIWYGVYDPDSRELRYASGGHPPGLLVPPGAERAERLATRGPAVGAVPQAVYENAACRLAPGSRLYLFCDGVFEVESAAGAMLGLDGLERLLLRVGGVSAGRLDWLVERIQAVAATHELEDDFTLLEVEVR